MSKPAEEYIDTERTDSAYIEGVNDGVKAMAAQLDSTVQGVCELLKAPQLDGSKYSTEEVVDMLGIFGKNARHLVETLSE